MAAENLDLLIKLLKMTTSSSEGEVLVAIRKANEHLKHKLSSDWESLLRGKVTIIEDPFAKAPTPPPGHQQSRRPPPPPSAPPRPATSPSQPRYAPNSPPPNAPFRPRPVNPAPNPFAGTGFTPPQPGAPKNAAPRTARQRRKAPLTIDDIV